MAQVQQLVELTYPKTPYNVWIQQPVRLHPFPRHTRSDRRNRYSDRRVAFNGELCDPCRRWHRRPPFWSSIPGLAG